MMSSLPPRANFLNSGGSCAPGTSVTITRLVNSGLPFERPVSSSSSLYAFAREPGTPGVAFLPVRACRPWANAFDASATESKSRSAEAGFAPQTAFRLVLCRISRFIYDSEEQMTGHLGRRVGADDISNITKELQRSQNARPKCRYCSNI